MLADAPLAGSEGLPDKALGQRFERIDQDNVTVFEVSEEGCFLHGCRMLTGIFPEIDENTAKLVVNLLPANNLSTNNLVTWQ